MNAVELVGSTLMVLGMLVSVLAAWGVLDFPSALARMHAATKSASLGLSLIALGAGVAATSWGLFGIGILVTAFLFLTAPISGHMVGRATYLAGRAEGLVHDDLDDCIPTPLAVPSRRGPNPSPIRVASVAVVWILLWRDISLGTVLGGLVVGLGIESIRRTAPYVPSIRIGGLIRFAVQYATMVIVSNARVAWEVVTPSNEQIREAIVSVRLSTSEPAVGLLLANAISFTPGSLTIELAAEPMTIYVHVLHFESVEQVEDDVRRIESLAADVFHPRHPLPGVSRRS